MTTDGPSDATRGSLRLYRDADGHVEVQVRLEHDTLWLSQRQMSALFDKDPDTIGLHLRNIYREGELSEAATTEESSVVQVEGRRQVRRRVRLYNLDAILSVGYRVSSKRGTQFRIWATGVLREHLVQGFTVNAARLRELDQAVRLIADTARRRDLSGDEARALLSVIGDFHRALGLLDDYDHQRVSKPSSSGVVTHSLDYPQARRIVDGLREHLGCSTLFGREKDQSLAGTLGAIMQTFDGRELYPSLEEKAARLLYLTVKNHSFVDGNKRIAAVLFLWFLDQNGGLLDALGAPRISQDGLVALTLLAAESRASEAEVVVRLIMHMLSPGAVP
jgi:prophage maintenance system killer protein